MRRFGIRQRSWEAPCHIRRPRGSGKWLRSLHNNLKASTVRFYSDNLRRYVLPLLGDRGVGSLTRADSRLLITSNREKGLKLTTVKGIARTLSTLLSQAVEDEKLPANPALRMGCYLRRGDEPKPIIQPLTREEAAPLVAVTAAQYPRWHPWVLCALRTGLRSGELLGLQWRDIDWHGDFLMIHRNLVRGSSPRRSRTAAGAWTCRRSSPPGYWTCVGSSASGPWRRASPCPTGSVRHSRAPWA